MTTHVPLAGAPAGSVPCPAAGSAPAGSHRRSRHASQALLAAALHAPARLARTLLARTLLVAAFLVALPWAGAAVAMQPLPFESPAQEARFRALAAELRCVMCQNQSLADSNAGIADDLRKEIFELMRSGRSDQEIKQFLTERYGEFVLYDPPIAPHTWLLWFGPLLLLAGGAIAVVVVVRRKAAPGTLPPVSGDDW